jgi:HK97 family phage major capsid protein
VLFRSPGQRGYMKQTQKFATTNGVAIWENGELNGYPAFASANVPSNLTKGTSTTICSAIIFGNFQEIFIGDWGAFEIIPDIYTLADKNSVKLTTIQLVDVGVRHAASFAAIKDAL